MTLQKALRNDNSSDNSEIEAKHEGLLKNLYNSEMNMAYPVTKAKGKIRRLLTTRSDNSVGISRFKDTPEQLHFQNSQETSSLNEEQEEVDSYFIKNSEGYKIEIITDEMLANNFGKDSCTTSNRMLNIQNDKEKVFTNKTKIKKSSSSNTKQMDSLVDISHFNMNNKKAMAEARKNRLMNLKC